MKNKGFTLIEVILSIAFLSVVSVVILQLFITSQNINASAQIKDMASLMATNAIEEIKASKTLEAGEQHTYFDESWQPVTTLAQSAYALLVTVTKDNQYATLYYIHIEVLTLEKTVLIEYTTKHHLIQGGGI